MDDTKRQPEAEQTSDERLKEELESLRSTFQEEWDKARGDLPDGPVIQSLEEIPEEPDEEEEDEDEGAQKTQSAAEQPKKHKTKKHSKALLAIPITLFVLVFLFFAYYFVMTMRYPEFSRFLTAFSGAIISSDPEEKLEHYERALELNEEIDMFRQSITDNAAMLTLETKGLAEAQKFVAAHYDDALLASASKEVRALAVYPGESEDARVNAVLERWKADNAAAAAGFFDAAKRLYEQKKAEPETDAETTSVSAEEPTSEETATRLSSAETEELTSEETETRFTSPEGKDVFKELGVPDCFTKDASDVLGWLLEGLEAEADDSDAGYAAAVNAYLQADDRLATVFLARSQSLLEHLTVVMYEKDDLANVVDLLKNDFTDELRTEASGEAFLSVKGVVDALLEADLDPEKLAASYQADEAVTADAIAATIPAVIPERHRQKAAETVYEIVLAEREKENNNLSLALTHKINALANAEEQGFWNVKALAADVFSVSVKMGIFDNADYIVEHYLKDEAQNPSAHTGDGAVIRAFIREYEDYLQLTNALKTCNDSFSACVNEDGTVDADAALKALDALMLGTTDAYLTGFANYYKCVAVNHGGSDGETAADAMLGYAEAWADAMPEHVLLWGRELAELYRKTYSVGSCIATAKKILEANVGDDYANAMLSLEARARGNTERALELAEEGIAKSGVYYESAREAAICLLLRGENKEAAEMLEKILPNSVTGDVLGLLRVVCVLYDGDDEEFKKTADALIGECDAAVKQHGLAYPDDVTALSDGEKSLRDVFLSGTYELN